MLIRLEYAADGKFENRPTFNVIHRNFPYTPYATQIYNGWLTIRTADLLLRYRLHSGPFTPHNLSVTLKVDGHTVMAHPRFGSIASPVELGRIGQAEDAELGGGASLARDHSGYSGEGFVAGIQAVGATISWQILDVPTSGTYPLLIRYSNNRGGDGKLEPRTMDLVINGVDAGPLTFPTTNNWDDWASIEPNITLRKGSDSVSLTYSKKDSGNINVDYIAVLKPGESAPTAPPAVKTATVPSSNNLGGWFRSLDGQSGPIPLHNGLLCRDGWYLLDDSQTAIFLPNGWVTPRPPHRGPYQDGYFFGYGHHYREALDQFANLTGHPPLLPRWAFGNWFSRYFPYHATDYQQKLIPEFRSERVPLDVLVIDTDFKAPSRWNGWEWNRKLFPHPTQFLAWCKQQGLHVTLNIHSSIQKDDPQFPLANRIAGGLINNGNRNYVWDWSVPAQARSYFALHHPFEKQGVRFWWLDWCCDNSRAGMPGITPDTWINYLYTHDIDRTGLRGFAFSRIGSSLQNWRGTYPAGPWAEHRYSVHFTGDTSATWAMLDFEDYFTIREGNIGLPYVTHDIGSFNGPPPNNPRDPDDLYARWVQLGAFQPILRLHSNHGYRLPWEYGAAARESADKFMRLRESLIPYLYTLSRQAHDTGLPMARGMYLYWPNDPYAYTFDHEYLFGREMLVAPIARPGDMASRNVWFPPGTWTDFFTGHTYRGPNVEKITCPLDRMPVFVKMGGIIPMQPYMEHVGAKPVDPLILRVYPGANGYFKLYEDAGDGFGYEHGQYAWTPIHLKSGVLTVEPEKGSYPGQLVRRSYRVEMVNVYRPHRVMVNGVVLPKQKTEGSVGWEYNPSNRTLTIQTAELPIHEAVSMYRQ